MICFLTSRTDDPDTGELNPANGLVDALKRCVLQPCRVLDICSNPDSHEITDYYADLTKGYLERAGFQIERFSVLDGRNETQAADLVRLSDLIILGGGHVPTQNRFFERIGLKELLRDFSGVVIGISAGSMNSADVVYAQPEEAGEAVDPKYRRFLNGLGLTKTMLLPHYQEIRNDVLDGLRVFEDIAYPDSFGRTFYAIPDGSYLLIENGSETLCGEAYRIQNGTCEQIAEKGDVTVF